MIDHNWHTTSDDIYTCGHCGTTAKLRRDMGPVVMISAPTSTAATGSQEWLSCNEIIVKEVMES